MASPPSIVVSNISSRPSGVFVTVMASTVSPPSALSGMYAAMGAAVGAGSVSRVVVSISGGAVSAAVGASADCTVTFFMRSASMVCRARRSA